MPAFGHQLWASIQQISYSGNHFMISHLIWNSKPGLLYDCTTWILPKRFEKNLDANYSLMLLVVGSTRQNISCVATCLPSHRLSKYHEQDILQKLVDELISDVRQRTPTRRLAETSFFSSVRTGCRLWPIGTDCIKESQRNTCCRHPVTTMMISFNLLSFTYILSA